MARPETAPKTALGARLREVRRAFDDPERDEWAARLGVSKNTIASYERGETEPTASVLAAYRKALGVNVGWLVTGQGEMFEEPSLAPAPRDQVDIVLLQRLGDTVQAVFVECKQTAPARAITEETGRLYNELLRMVPDIRDRDIVDAVIPVLRQRFKERIAHAEPGTGKRSAS